MAKPNRYGLYDSPKKIGEKEMVAITPDDFEQQLDAGAFFMSRDDAIRLGLIHPDYEPDTVIAGMEKEA